MRTCTKCKRTLKADCFTKKRGKLNTRCKDCVAEYYKAYYHGSEQRRRSVIAATKKYKAKNKWRDLSRKYKIEEQELIELFQRYGGRCHICKLKPATCVDHCHHTGKVRGALCGSCNRGLGLLGDSLDSILAAQKYLAAVSPLSDKESKG